MSYAPSSTYFDSGDGSIVGNFHEKSGTRFFEYSENRDDLEQFSEYPHKVWVTTPRPGIDSGFRYARVLKSVAHLVVDEDETGAPVVEKWFIKAHNIYLR